MGLDELVSILLRAPWEHVAGGPVTVYPIIGSPFTPVVSPPEGQITRMHMLHAQLPLRLLTQIHTSWET